MDEWMDSLRGARLEPTAAAQQRIAEEVRRRRRRRRTVALGVAGAVTALGVGVAAVLLPLSEDRTVVTDVPSPTAPTSGSEAPDGLFSCATENMVFADEDLPPTGRTTSDLQEWKRVYAEITAAEFDGFAIHRAEILQIGVVVLATGDLDEARRVLVGEYGVAVVQQWPPQWRGMDEQDLLDLTVQWALDPVLATARRRTRGIPGSAGFASWTSTAAILVQWKQPVPAEVLALEDIVFKTGGRIVVKGVRYSSREVRQAQRRVHRAARLGEINAEVSMSYGCQDGEGLIVGVAPETLEGRRAALQDQLAEIAGMPVMVVPEERPTADW